jgi:hypothetical protein
MKLADFPPAARLLFLCARTEMDAGASTHLQALVRAGLDWDWVLQHARAHRILPLVYANLRKLPKGDVLARVMAQIHLESQEIARRNLVRTRELIKILQAFEARQIPVVPFKGPILATMVYNHLSLRSFVDLDVLVHPHTYLQARDILYSLGFQNRYMPGSQEETACVKLYPEMVFSRQDTIVDLHWSLTPPLLLPSEYDRAIFKNLSSVTIAGTIVHSLSPEDLLLFLCFHGTKPGHHWRRISWICDVAELLRAFPNLDWETVLHEAERLGLQRSLCLGLYLARDWLDASLPETFERVIQSDKSLPYLAQQVAGWLFDPSVEASNNFICLRFYLRARERWRDRLRFLVMRVFWPTKEDWESAALPAGLYFLYRPYRLAGKYAGKLLRSLPLQKVS